MCGLRLWFKIAQICSETGAFLFLAVSSIAINFLCSADRVRYQTLSVANLKISICCTPTYSFLSLAGMQTFTSNLRLFLVLSLSVRKENGKIE